MSWLVLQSASSAPSSTGQPVLVTYANNLSAGSKLIAYALSTTGSGFTTVLDSNSNSFTQVGPTVTSGFAVLQTWVLDTPAGDVGTKPTITATGEGATGTPGMLIQEVSGLLPGTSCLDGTQGSVTGTGGTSTGTPTYSSTASNEYLVSFYADDGGGGGADITAPSGYTPDPNIVNNNNPGDIGVAYNNSTGGTESGGLTRTSTGAQWGVILVAFQLAASNAPVLQDSPRLTLVRSGLTCSSRACASPARSCRQPRLSRVFPRAGVSALPR